MYGLITVIQLTTNRTIHLQRVSMFSDIQNHWTKASVLAAAWQNIFKGYPDGTFRPNASVTRAEFAAIISTSLSIKQSSSRAGITFK
jgi:hypothetical protein